MAFNDRVAADVLVAAKDVTSIIIPSRGHFTVEEAPTHDGCHSKLSGVMYSFPVGQALSGTVRHPTELTGI